MDGITGYRIGEVSAVDVLGCDIQTYVQGWKAYHLYLNVMYCIFYGQ